MLQKCFLGILIVLAAGAVMATDGPIDKGSLMLDGTAYFRSQSGDLWEMGDDALTTINIGNGSLGLTEAWEIGPTVGYFVSPGLMLGAQLAYLRYAFGDANLSALGIGPTLVYYVNTDKSRPEPKGALYPYFGGSFTYGSISDEDDKIADMMQYGGKAGVLLMISNAVGADFGVKFQSDSWKFNGAPERTTGTTIQVGVGIAAFIY